MKKTKIFSVAFICVLLYAFGWGCGSCLDNGTLAGSRPRLSADPITIIADQDTYSDMDNPTSNYGGQNYMYAGYKFSGFAASYLHFNFTAKPATFTAVYLRLDINTIFGTTNLSLNLHNHLDSWNEYSLTYLTQPAEGEVLASLDLRIAIDEPLYIDITSFFEGDFSTQTALSLSINASSSEVTNYVTFYTREIGYSWVYAPALIFLQSGQVLPDIQPTRYSPLNGEILPTMDSFVDSGDLTNYGGLDNAYFGDYIGEYRVSLLHFEQIPKSTSKLDLVIPMYGVSETMTLYVTVIDSVQTLSPWNELDLNWLNWPYGSPIDYMVVSQVNLTVLMTSSTDIHVDLSPWIGNSSLDIILTLDVTCEDYCYFTTKEGSTSYSSPVLLNVDPTTTPTVANTTNGKDSAANSSASGDGGSIDGYSIDLIVLGNLLGCGILMVGGISKRSKKSRI